MISISCLESKLLNNNNWYGRFQLAPFQKGEGLTIANALRRTLLAEKRAFFITWVDFYNAEIPYSVLTGMRESIFDILLNLKQVIFTSDKVLPVGFKTNSKVLRNSNFLKLPLNNNFKAQKIKPVSDGIKIQYRSTFEPNFNRSEEKNRFKNSPRGRIEIPYSHSVFAGKYDCAHNFLQGQRSSGLNHKYPKTQNVFCKNQILGKIINSKNETSSRVFRQYNDSGFKNQLLYTSNSKTMSDSTYIGYICAKGPTIIYAKNIKLPKGLKCVDPNKYITTLADDGLFYLRFALTTEIKTLPLSNISNLSAPAGSINQGIKFNRIRSFSPHTEDTVTRNFQGPAGKLWPVYYTPPSGLINEQRLLLTNDSIKQFNFQNTSILANIQKTCLLNIQIKHYYYKCGRFDRFLFDVIKPFKPNLISTYYKKPCLLASELLRYPLKKEKNVLPLEHDWKILTDQREGTGFQKIFERQKCNSYLLVHYKPPFCGDLRDSFSKVKRSFLAGPLPKKKLLTTPHVGADKIAGIFENTPLRGSKNECFPVEPFVFSFVKWQKIFKSMRTSSIYNYLQKLNTSQATRIYFLLTKLSPESKIALLGSQLKPGLSEEDNNLQADLESNLRISLLKDRHLKNDAFSFGNFWSKENTTRQAFGFLFREFIDLSVNNLKERSSKKKTSAISFTSARGMGFKTFAEANEQIQSDLSVFRLYQAYINKSPQGGNIDFLFQCSKNHIVSALGEKFCQGVFESNSLSDFPPGADKNPVDLKNVMRYSPPAGAELGLISTEKLITKIKSAPAGKQWSFLHSKHQKQTKISLFLQGRELLSPQGPSKNKWLRRKTSKYDNNLREFFYQPRAENKWPKKIGFLSSSNKYPLFNSVRISTNLRAKPSICIKQESYKPIWILPCQFEKNTDTLSGWFDNMNLSGPKQTQTNNSVVLKPIYLNIEQMVYILKQTTKFRKNQRVNPIFFNSLTRFKNHNHYPASSGNLPPPQERNKIAGFFSPGGKVSTSASGDNLPLWGFGPYLFSARNWVKSLQNFHFFTNLRTHKIANRFCSTDNTKLKKQTRPYFFSGKAPAFFFASKASPGNIEFSKKKVSTILSVPARGTDEKTTWPRFLLSVSAKNHKTQISNTFYIQRSISCRIRILGNDFLFRPINKICGDLGFPGHHERTSYFPLLSLFAPLSARADLCDEPYNINIYHSKIFFNLRYTYPFKSTIFETFLPFLNLFENLGNFQTNSSWANLMQNSDYFPTQRGGNKHFGKWSKNTRPPLFYLMRRNKIAGVNNSHQETTRALNTKIISSSNFDYIQYNQSFKIYTNLAYTSLKTYEPHLSKYPAGADFNRRNLRKPQYNGAKVISFQLVESLIQDYTTAPAKKNNTDWILAGEDEKKNGRKGVLYSPLWVGPAGKLNVYKFLMMKFQLSNLSPPARADKTSGRSRRETGLTNSDKWFIMNNSNFNDAFIIIPYTWFLNFQLSKSHNVTNLFYRPILFNEEGKAPPGNWFLPLLQKLFNIYCKNEPIFFDSLDEKKEVIKNQLHWLRTTSKNNNLISLGSHLRAETKNLIHELRDGSKNYDKENTPTRNFTPARETHYSDVSVGAVKMNNSHGGKNLVINFENIYYKNFLWNSRKISLRILNNAKLPLVTNRKYSISHFIPKKKDSMTAFMHPYGVFFRNTAKEPVMSFSPKFSNPFVWGFKQKLRPYLASVGIFKMNAWKHRNVNNIIFKPGQPGISLNGENTISTGADKKNWLDQLIISNEFPGGAFLEKKNGSTYPDRIKMHSNGELPFYSIRHKILGTTNFMCLKTDQKEESSITSINENQIPMEGQIIKPDSSSSIHKRSMFSAGTAFSYPNISSSYFDKMKILNSRSYNQKTQLLFNFFKNPRRSVYLTSSTNESSLQNSDDFFSEPFSSLRSKWRPFFTGSLRYSQEKNTSSELSFLDLKTSPKKSSQRRENQNNSAPAESPLINNLWSSLFFCRYSLYAISTKSDLFFQNLISNDNWTPSSNKSQISQTSSTRYIKNIPIPRFSDFQRNFKANNTMQSLYNQNHTDQFLNVKLSLKFYYETIQKILKSPLFYSAPAGGKNKPPAILSPHLMKYRGGADYGIANYDYYWQKAIHCVILSRFKISQFHKKKIPAIAFARARKANSISGLKSKYSICRLKNHERYFGNPVRRHISQNGLSHSPGPFCNIKLLTKRYNNFPLGLVKLPRRGRTNQHVIKSWNFIMWTDEADLYFCFRYPLFIQNCNLPWQKSKYIFCMQKHWLNRITLDLKSPQEQDKLTRSIYLSKTPARADINRATNTSLLMTYTQLSSSRNNRNQPLLHNKLWTNITSLVHMDLQNKGSYGTIGYFTIKESLNSIYKVNYIVESQVFESKSMSKLALNYNQNSQGFRKPSNLIEDSHNPKRFESIQRDYVNMDSSTIRHAVNFLNETPPLQGFFLNKTPHRGGLNSLNPLENLQINRSEIENENEYIQIDIWTNGELSPRQALLNAFRKLFELFYNLSKYNCLKPIEI